MLNAQLSIYYLNVIAVHVGISHADLMKRVFCQDFHWFPTPMARQQIGHDSHSAKDKARGMSPTQKAFPFVTYLTFILAFLPHPTSFSYLMSFPITL